MISNIPISAVQSERMLNVFARLKTDLKAALGCWVAVEGHRISWNLLQLGAVDIPVDYF